MSKKALLREVEPTKWRHLPHRFDLPHAVAFFFHDQLARLVVDLERTGALSVRFDLSEGERHEITNLKGEELWAWLETTGRRDVIDDLTYRQLTAAVVSDAAHFLCEALIASGKESSNGSRRSIWARPTRSTGPSCFQETQHWRRDRGMQSQRHGVGIT